MLDQLQHQILLEKNQLLLGKDLEILVEGQYKGKWRGRTLQNKIVFFESNADCLGQTMSIHVKRSGAYSLSGTVNA